MFLTSAHSFCCWKWMDCIVTSFQVEGRNQKPCGISQAKKLNSLGCWDHQAPQVQERCIITRVGGPDSKTYRSRFISRLSCSSGSQFVIGHGRSTWSYCWILTSFCIHFSTFHFVFYTLSVSFPFFSIPSTTTFGSLRRWPKRWVWMPRLQGKPLLGNLTDRVVHGWSKIWAWRWGCFVDFGWNMAEKRGMGLV